MKNGAAKFLRAKLTALNKPVVIVLLVCLSLVALNIIVAQQHRSYNSDDVSWQTTLMSWRPFSGQNAYVGAKDNFVVNLPFIVLADNLVHTGPEQLLLASLMMALVNFALFYAASLYFLKLIKVRPGYRTLLPFVWLASFGFAFSALFLNTVWRDYEIGVSFVYYALAAGYYFGDIRPLKNLRSKLLSLLVFLVSSCFVASDPYFLYLTVAPVALFFAVQYVLGKVPRRKLLAALAWSAGVWVGSKILAAVLALAGIIVPKGSGGLGLSGLSHAGAAFGRLVDSLGSIFGAKVTWLAAANLAVLLLIICLVLRRLWPKELVSRLKKGGPQVWLGFFGALALLATAASFAVDENGIYIYRYLLLDVYIFVLILALHTKLLKRWLGVAVSGVLLIAVASNLFSTYSDYTSAAQAVPPNANNVQLVATVRKLGLHKGYAGYWDGNINTYYAGNIDFLPVTCKGGKTTPIRFLVNGARFNAPSQRSFVLVNPNMYPPLCSEKQLLAQFGRPAQQVQAAGVTILVYNYDVIASMPQ